MKGKIGMALKGQEAERGCRILFAVESGSRAWGFASPDSDYDVRVIYVRPLDWYLGLEEGLADTWNAMLPDELDIAAWDLRKALRQFQKSNASFLEWLGSPIVYSDCGLIGELKEMIDRVFNPTHVAYHYASMFRHATEDKAEDGTIGVKKLCYALRANTAVIGSYNVRRCRRRLLVRCLMVCRLRRTRNEPLTSCWSASRKRRKRTAFFPTPDSGGF